MNNFAIVKIWGKKVGVVFWDITKNVAVFEFDKVFLDSSLDISPIHLSLKKTSSNRTVYTFPYLNFETYKGLPGFIADSLPDKFGNQIINAWLAQQGRAIESFNPVERLCYIGKRAMGALEFEPEIENKKATSSVLEIDDLIAFAKLVLDEKADFHTNLKNKEGFSELLQISSSAGGARAKAIIAYNQTTGEVRSGQIDGLDGFEYWIIKFDGVTNQQLGDPKGYGNIEYAYYLMAKEAGITMMESQLKKENNRAHFMTKRFDRVAYEKIHMQTLCGLAHFDYNQPGMYSYEQCFQIMRELRLSYTDQEQMFRRMVFNIMARNQDDHTKNISFLMNKDGNWKLSPAYDVTFAYNPSNFWLQFHQMTINGKKSAIVLSDVLAVAENMNIKNPKRIIEEVKNSILNWHNFAQLAEINKDVQKEIDLLFNHLL